MIQACGSWKNGQPNGADAAGDPGPAEMRAPFDPISIAKQLRLEPARFVSKEMIP